jgi:hypothetical protein
MRPRDDGFSHAVLFITIAAAVAVGNILSAAVIGAYVEHKARLALAEAERAARAQAERARQSHQQLQQQQDSARTAEDERLRSQRASDPNGQRLGRACNEWREANTQLGSYTTRTETAKHCRRYEHYVHTGLLSGAP